MMVVTIFFFFVVAVDGSCGRVGRPSEEVGQTTRKLVFGAALYRRFIIVFLEPVYEIGINDQKNRMLKELMLL
jgi:hypothetical protein